MSYPKNKEEWWALVDGNWEDLLSILSRFTQPTDKEITEILQTKKNRDGYKLCRYLNDAWAKAPDKQWIRDIPGWFDLCDLCSESYVLED